MSWQPPGYQPPGYQPPGWQPGFETLPQPVLRIVKPQMRTIDAKSIADNYNRGMPIEPDYTWPGGRKFYQNKE